jgi:hypothetical protein
MSKRQKPPTRPERHMEKPVMEQPQEEFVAPQSVPSRDLSREREDNDQRHSAKEKARAELDG